jgi:hypothetical protein
MRIHLQRPLFLTILSVIPIKQVLTPSCHSIALKQASISPHDTKREGSELAQLLFATYLLPFLALARVDK